MPPQQIPSTPPSTPPRQTSSTPPHRHDVQQTTSNLGDPTHVDIRLPAWIVGLSDISINISPRRGTAQAGEFNHRSVTPIVTMVHHQLETQVAEAPPPPPPTPQHMLPRAFTATQLGTPLRTQSSQVVAGPRPIYPLQPGEVSPPRRVFRDSRAHRYYVIFIGPRLGVYHEYWFVYHVIILAD